MTINTADGTVLFNYDEFVAAYPEFGAMTKAQLTSMFDDACVILNNTVSSVVCNLEKRQQMLYKLLAHIAFLNNRGGGIVGALSSASEGSVSAGFSALGSDSRAAWFNQTQYGALFWQMTLPYRSGVYISL